MADDDRADARIGDETDLAGRSGISEDWLATIVGLVLVLLVLAGVIGKGIVP